MFDKMHPELRRWFKLHLKIVLVVVVILTVFYLFMSTVGLSFMSIMFNYFLLAVTNILFSFVFARRIASEHKLTLKEGIFGADKV